MKLTNPTMVNNLRDRCCIRDDCWIWKGAQTKGVPIYAHRKEDGTRANSSARRLMYRAAKGVELPREHFVVPDCGNAMCLNPAHLKARTRSWVNHMSSQTADARVKKALAAKVRWARDASMSMEKARQIRSSTGKTQNQLAEEYGVSQSLVSLIQRGLLWAEANPFAGLMASNDSTRRAA
jgi:DNA-binding transcriptional regulator YiaG